MWQFWIDVGGTFTDCLARTSSGRLLRHKRLSSGVTKGTGRLEADELATNRCIDEGRIGDPDQFWTGYQISVLDRTGNRIGQATVSDFDATTGTLTLEAARSEDAALKDAGGEHSLPTSGNFAYELASDEPAPLVAIRYLLGLRLDDAIPRSIVRLGTTRGTNALLTRGGARTALVTTKGFGDILLIGDQDRPRLFDLDIVKRTPLFTKVIEVEERITADGELLVSPNETTIRAQLVELRDRGIESLAVCLLNAYAQPQHEQLVGHIAREFNFAEVSLSHESAPLIKMVARGDTTVLDAYLTPVLREYVASLRAKLVGSDLRLMTSAGGLVQAEEFSGKDCILSGPAGGVVGFARVAEAVASRKPQVRAIGFDMGGTSTDVARYEGSFRLQYEAEKAGVRIVAPMMAIETVAAGGGSCCNFDGVKLVVGPESAGADPGPACYGRGGPLSVTDINLALGKILPAHFPFPLDEQATQARLTTLATEIQQKTGTNYTPIELADGFLRVANANMVEAIRSISIAEGVDPREYILVAFGGAAGQHACAVARELNIERVLLHQDAGILSAWGIGLADITRHAVAGVYRSYSPSVLEELEATFADLTASTREQVEREGVAAENIQQRRSLDLRYAGLDSYLTIAESANTDGAAFDYAAAYEQEHERLYGYRHLNRELEIVAARVETIGRCSDPATASTSAAAHQEPEAAATTTIHFDAQPHETRVYHRVDLKPGDVLRGPAIILEDNSTIIVDPHWQAEVYTGGELMLTDEIGSHKNQAPQTPIVSTESDPVMLELFNNQFAAIARQMGITLQNTATSVNVKERLDFSCAIFTPTGDLVVNAPHIPVHLGAMSETVRCVLADNPNMTAGDVFVTNDPYRGGSHLPDITVVTPMFDAAGRELLFFTASRAHHAEIGGIEPGSMPPSSTNLAEEGVRISNFKLVDAGTPRFDALGEHLSAGLYPSRTVADNLADLSAQVAANRQGLCDLERLIERYSLPVVQAYTVHIQTAAEKKMRAALARLTDGERTFVDYLDYVVVADKDRANTSPDSQDSQIESAPIAVKCTIRGDEAEIDFAGTGSVLPNNLNANRAIVTAAVMYVMRCLIDEDIPLNEGVLAPIQLKLPTCLLNPPAAEKSEDCPAVVGGNVETSQRVVDVLLGALGIAAASQGTMNNVLFGDDTFGYYETICGGAGATANSPGADAVHTHMTNTRLTDPEVLEQKYPVRVCEFSIRRGSGGDGRQAGGDGIIRRLEFLRDLDVSILSTRRGPHPPYGAGGGKPGQLGRNLLKRRTTTTGGKDNSSIVMIALPAQAQFTAQAGDLLTIETPGGGGYGEAPGDDNASHD